MWKRRRPALDHVSFSVQNGEFIVICGESGCGKTTLLKLLKTGAGASWGEIRTDLVSWRGPEELSNGRQPVRSVMCCRIRKIRP
ncbi:MAG: ATP-binding cassette domain-containing protein [Lachnospiraceae bacterium]